MSIQKIKHILVPLDGSENSTRGLEAAVHLANEHEASLTTIHVIHIPHRNTSKQRKQEEPAPQFILDAQKIAEKNGIPFHNRVLEGDPGHSIVEYSNTHDIDLVVIGARGLGTFKKIFLGSVSSYVLHKSKIAVMLVR